MKCPYCSTTVHLDYEDEVFVNENTDHFTDQSGYCLRRAFCPSCEKLIVQLEIGKYNDGFNDSFIDPVTVCETVYPKFPSCSSLSDYIPERYVKLYNESEQVNNISPRASATLSRYLLQMLLHEELNIRKKNLELEIQELETKSNVPSTLIAVLHVMRRVANFGAHPKKSENSAEIVEIEPGEAEIMLEVIRELFDHVFVKPAQQQEALQRIEEKFGIKCEA